MLLKLITLGLATWRVSHLLVHEEGPWGFLEEIRHVMGIERYDDGTLMSYPTWSPLHCVWCTSIWVAGALMLLPKSTWLCTWLAGSAIAIGIEEVYGKSISTD